MNVLTQLPDLLVLGLAVTLFVWFATRIASDNWSLPWEKN